VADNKWYVLETPCYPAKWKVTFAWYVQDDCGDNDSSNYYRDQAAAQLEADRRNTREQEKEVVNG
jgi:hypothetical protein